METIFKVKRTVFLRSLVNPQDQNYAPYTAKFLLWSKPDVAKCMCSDGRTRFIPKDCLVGDLTQLPEQQNGCSLNMGRNFALGIG
jgi:hypothetical protein